MRQTAARAPRARRLPGEEGTWVFIFGDMTVFAVLFGVYLSYRAQDQQLFADSQVMLDQDIGALNTLLLLTSSLFVFRAVGASRRGSPRAAAPWLVGALVCGAAFIVDKAMEYGDKLSRGIDPGTNEFFTYFYALTGLHLFHLVCGMVLLGVALVLTRRDELTARQRGYFEGIACFWHMVDVLWIVLYPLLYLVP